MARSRESIQKAVETEFVALVKEVFEGTLLSVTAYGSYVKNSFDPRVSDVNVLVIVSSVDPARLRRFGHEGRRLLRWARITPLVLSEREFQTSSDVFPMEYFDIVEHHSVLTGDDPTSTLEIDAANLRHEIEHQLRGSLVALRQLAVAAARPRLFRKLILKRELEQWYGSLAAIFRGLLRLKGVSPVPTSGQELVGAVNHVFGLEDGPFKDLIECRGNQCPEVFDMMDNMQRRLAELVAMVDSLDARGGM